MHQKLAAELTELFSESTPGSEPQSAPAAGTAPPRLRLCWAGGG